MINRILINREECEVRVAFLEEQTLVELHTEKFDEQSIVNNLYRGKVQDVVPGLQAAFVDCGLGRNMFLHFMDIRPESLVLSEADPYEAMEDASKERVPGRIERRGRRPRQDPNVTMAPPVKRGDDIIVQVVKDEIGGKAPRVTTNLALAGRYLVMLPFPSQEGGVSRKIATGPERHRLKRVLGQLKETGYSFIVRTAGIDQDEEAIRKDAESLIDTWESTVARYKKLGRPGLINNDHDLIARLVRDAFPPEFDEVVCDNEADAQEVGAELAEHMPALAGRVQTYTGPDNIFDHFGIEKQIQRAMAHKIWLPSGGYLIVDENEALTAIDVNTGRFTGKKDQEKTSLKTNLEACEVLAQLVRMRDIGGIIVIDFIDMLNHGHREKVAEELRRHLKRDRAKLAIGKIGDFGLMMLTRKRQRLSLHKQLHDPCPYCQGAGVILKPDEVFRQIKYETRRLLANEPSAKALLITAHTRMIELLNHRYYAFLDYVRRSLGVDVVLRGEERFHLEDFTITPAAVVEGPGLNLPLERVPADARIQEISLEPLTRLGAGQVLPAAPLSPVHEDGEEPEDEGAWDRTGDEWEDFEDEDQPFADEAEEEDEEPAPQQSARDHRGRRLRHRHREERDQTAESEEAPAFDAAEADSVEADDLSEADPAAARASELATPRKRTRRGTRGGRGRRRGDEDLEETTPLEAPPDAPSIAEPAVPSAKQPEPSAPAPPPPPPKMLVPEGPLKLKPARRSSSDELLAGVLGNLDEDIEKAPAKEASSNTAKQPEKSAAAPSSRVAAKQALSGILEGLLDDAPEEQPKKATRKTGATKKAATGTKKAAEQKAPARKAGDEEKPKATRSRKAATKAAPTVEGTAIPQESAAMSKSPKRQPRKQGTATASKRAADSAATEAATEAARDGGTKETPLSGKEKAAGAAKSKRSVDPAAGKAEEKKPATKRRQASSKTSKTEEVAEKPKTTRRATRSKTAETAEEASGEAKKPARRKTSSKKASKKEAAEE